MPLGEAPKEKVVCMLVFSWCTGSWESQEFVLGHCLPWTTYDVNTVQRDIDTEEERTWWSAEYWRVSLYVHCHIGLLMIMQVSEGKYDTAPEKPARALQRAYSSDSTSWFVTYSLVDLWPCRLSCTVIALISVSSSFPLAIPP
ncbi:hypothetical protein VPH35_135635 [Triticum aestivum]|uniref:Uncharacterized protein n=1 Tax=Aegilops tauschii subsp. strangulata TaxID=200361 RepID=A0A453QWJ0_AEGTS